VQAAGHQAAVVRPDVRVARLGEAAEGGKGFRVAPGRQGGEPALQFLRV
jgi:hypothetical protein